MRTHKMFAITPFSAWLATTLHGGGMHCVREWSAAGYYCDSPSPASVAAARPAMFVISSIHCTFNNAAGLGVQRTISGQHVHHQRTCCLFAYHSNSFLGLGLCVCMWLKLASDLRPRASGLRRVGSMLLPMAGQPAWPSQQQATRPLHDYTFIQLPVVQVFQGTLKVMPMHCGASGFGLWCCGWYCVAGMVGCGGVSRVDFTLTSKKRHTCGLAVSSSSFASLSSHACYVLAVQHAGNGITN